MASSSPPGGKFSQTMAPSSSPPGGREGEEEANLTPLQRHVAFFDRNNDGIIYPSETYQGFRAIGCGVVLSAVSAVFINGFLSPKTNPGKSPFPYFPIYVKNIQEGKHGSDTGVYDSEGRFVASKFEEIFQKHAKTNPEALSSKELKEMLKANQEPNDRKGLHPGRNGECFIISAKTKKDSCTRIP